MAAANFVVITNGGGCALTGTADIDVLSFRELRLVVDYLEGSLSVAIHEMIQREQEARHLNKYL